MKNKIILKDILNIACAILVSCFIIFVLYTIFTTQQKVNEVVRFINAGLKAQEKK